MTEKKFKKVMTITGEVYADSLEKAREALARYPDHLDRFLIEAEIQQWTEASKESGLPGVWKTVEAK